MVATHQTNKNALLRVRLDGLVCLLGSSSRDADAGNFQEKACADENEDDGVHQQGAGGAEGQVHEGELLIAVT